MPTRLQSLIVATKLDNFAFLLPASQVTWNARSVEKQMKGGNYMIISKEFEKRFETIQHL